MSIGAALQKSISGLQGTQAGLSVISTNVASANQAGYVKRELQTLDGGGDGVRAPGLQSASIVRALDVATQNLMRQAITQHSAAETIDGMMQQLDAVMGGPSSRQGLDASWRNFSTALVTASNDRGNQGAQMALVHAARSLAASLQEFSRAVQSLRSEAEQAIGASVTELNALTSQLADVNLQLGTLPLDNDTLDQRDGLINRLAALGDFNVKTDVQGRVTVTTRGGMALVGESGAAPVSFDGQGQLGPQDLYSSNPALRGVGTLSVNGLDLLAGQHFTSGRLGALIALRDRDLVASQTMVDDLAAGLALAARDPAAPSTQSLFLDGATAFTATGRDDPQRIGLSQRLVLNPLYASAPEQLETMGAASTENVFVLLHERLATTDLQTRRGLLGNAPGETQPDRFLHRMLADHAHHIAQAHDEAEMKSRAKTNFETLFASRHGVDINAQLADMISLQNAYAANANVIRTIKDMLAILNNM